MIERTKLLEISKLINDKFNFKNTFMISAKRGEGVDFLLNEILKLIPCKPWIYQNKNKTIYKWINRELNVGINKKDFEKSSLLRLAD